MLKFISIVLMAAAAVPPVRADEPAALRLAGAVPLTGVEGRIDHMAVDENGGRLFVAALGNNTVEVIDLKTARQVKRLSGLKEPQGIAFLPDLARLVVASGQDGKVRVYDADGTKLLGTVDGLDDADNVRYDPAAKLVYVGYGSGALAVIEPQAIRKVADVKLDGHPESFQLEAKGSRIFANVPTAQQIAVVDRQTRSVIAKWPVEGAASNFPMALDEQHRRLFVGCRKPAKLLLLDADTGKRVATLDCVGDTDDVFYDASTSRIYVSGGAGVVTVVQQTDADHYQVTGQTPTAPGARTSYFVPGSHRLYVAVPHRSKQPAELKVFDTAP